MLRAIGNAINECFKAFSKGAGIGIGIMLVCFTSYSGVLHERVQNLEAENAKLKSKLGQ